MTKKIISAIVSLAIVFSVFFNSSIVSVADEIEPENEPKVLASIDTIFLGINSKGFNPSKGNSLLVQANISIPSDKYIDANLRLRILNSNGKYVFQKVFKNASTGFLSYKWNGKAGKKNEANLPSGKYVANGKYKAELYLYGATSEAENQLVPATKTKSFKIKSDAPSGSDAFNNRKRIPLFTGNKNIDYMAEQMIKSAGIKSSMPEDEKVRRIYNYMTFNFNHIHSEEFFSQPDKYNFKKLKSKINSYKKKSDKNLTKGKLLYNYQASAYDEMHMQKRCGECNAHAAAFQILCNHIGIESGICSGYYLNRNGTKAGHYWNYAVVGGIKYYYDVDVEIQNRGKGQGDYYWYKKTFDESKKTHEYHNIN